MDRLAIATVAFLGAAALAAPAGAGTYSLCEGEYSEARKGSKCPENQPYMYCYGSAAAVAASLCKQEGSTGKPTVVQLRSIGGHKCGYTFYQITCQ